MNFPLFLKSSSALRISSTVAMPAGTTSASMKMPLIRGSDAALCMSLMRSCEPKPLGMKSPNQLAPCATILPRLKGLTGVRSMSGSVKLRCSTALLATCAFFSLEAPAMMPMMIKKNKKRRTKVLSTMPVIVASTYFKNCFMICRIGSTILTKIRYI